MQKPTIKNKTWRKVKLGETGKIVTGKTPPTVEKDYFDGDFPFITPTDITDFNVRYNYVTDRFLSKKWFAKAKNLLIPRNSTCFVCIGSTIGKICLVKEDSFTNQQINTVIVDSRKADFNYIYYLLKYNQRNIVKEYGGGGAAKSIINKSTFENIEFFIPNDPVEQKRIAGILSVFDDKIELNNKISRTLEQMASAIFKEWFVKFRFPGYEKAKSRSERSSATGIKMVDSELGKIPEGWEVKNIMEIIKRLPVGKRYDNETALPKGKVPILDQGQSGIIGFHNKEAGVKANTKNPVAVFSNHTCYYRLITFDFSCIQNVIPYIGMNGYPALFVYYLTRNKIKMSDYKGHWPEFAAQKFIVPPQPLAMRFSQKIQPFIENISKNEKENQTLSSLRDLLLPKLMSGEMRV